MKKTIILAVLALMGNAAMSAQEQANTEQREKAIGERIEKAAERMAKDFNLEGDKQKAFVETYTAYQKEMFATNQMRGESRQREHEGADKEFTAEEAQTRIQENFARQEKQIATMQKRLDVQKKYAEELSKALTPQQVLKVLNPQRRSGNRDGAQQREEQQGQRRGGFDGGERRGGFGGGPRGGFGGGF